MVLAVCGIAALTFIYDDGPHVWSWWFPDQPFNPTVKRWLRYLLQVVTAAFAYVQVRFYLNLLTGVDPGNFPTAVAALTVLNTLVRWLVVGAIVTLVMAGVYALMAYMAGIRGKLGLAELGGISARRWKRRLCGVVGIFFISMAAYGLPADTLFAQRAVRTIASLVLVTTEFSYDQTCAISSEHRLVAQLKDRRERQVSMVSIAEERSFGNFTFSRGTCDDPVKP
jgi:hypothetical protein